MAEEQKLKANSIPVEKTEKISQEKVSDNVITIV